MTWLLAPLLSLAALFVGAAWRGWGVIKRSAFDYKGQ